MSNSSHFNKIKRIFNGDDSSSGEESSPNLFSHKEFIPFRRVVTNESKIPAVITQKGKTVHSDIEDSAPPSSLTSSTTTSGLKVTSASTSSASTSRSTNTKKNSWTYKSSSSTCTSSKPKQKTYSEDWSSDDGHYAGKALPPVKAGGWYQTSKNTKKRTTTYVSEKKVDNSEKKRKLEEQKATGTSEVPVASANHMQESDKMEEDQEEDVSDPDDYSSVDTADIYIHHVHGDVHDFESDLLR